MNRSNAVSSLVFFMIVAAAFESTAYATNCWLCTGCDCKGFSPCPVNPIVPPYYPSQSSCQLVCCTQSNEGENEHATNSSEFGFSQPQPDDVVVADLPIHEDQDNSNIAQSDNHAEAKHRDWTKNSLWAIIMLSVLILPLAFGRSWRR